MSKACHIEWTCEACGFPVEGEEGYIHIDKMNVGYLRHLRRKVKARVRARSNGDLEMMWNRDDFLEAMGQVRWEVHHRRCDPDPDGNDYWFTVDRARTHAQLVEWTAHLMGKDWIGVTDWADFIRRAMREQGVSTDKGARPSGQRVEVPAEVKWWLSPGEPCEVVRRQLEDHSEALVSHGADDSTRDHLLAVVFLGQRGHQGVGYAVNAMERAYKARGGEEWAKMLDEVYRMVTVAPRPPAECTGDKDCVAR